MGLANTPDCSIPLPYKFEFKNAYKLNYLNIIMDLILGIDDAGRGPVIGNMVLAGCILNQEVEQELRELGVMDSKLLTRKKREKLIEIIKKKATGFQTHKITPSEIDTGMGIGLNLNETEAMAAGIIINELVKDKKLSNLKIVIDCPSVNTNSWKKKLLEYTDNKNLNIVCEHKADMKFTAVSAASIIAKVTRDGEIEKLKKKIGKDFGSGYPADPKTRVFLKKYVDDAEIAKHRIFRQTWSTWRRAKEAKSQRKLPDY